MKGVPHRVVDPADVEADGVVEVPDVAGGHSDVVGEGAVPVHADDLRVRADVRVAGPAEMAAPADDVPFRRHPVTDLHVRDEGPDALHHAGELVADGEWRTAAPLRPRIPVVDVDVGTADAGGADVDEDFILADRRDRNIPQLESDGGACLDQCAHRRTRRKGVGTTNP